MAKEHWYAAALLCLFGVTLFYSTYKLTESPAIWFDEGIYIQAADSLANTGTQSIQTAPGVLAGTAYVTGGYPFLLPVGLSMKLFGPSLLHAREAMVIFILACVILSWLLIYRLFGSFEALLALVLLATFPLLYGNGKNVIGEVPGMLYTLLALWSVWRLEAGGWQGTRRYITTGILFGLAAVTKPIFFLLPIAATLVLATRARHIQWRNILILLAAAAMPFLVWVYLQFGGQSPPASLFGHYVNPYAESSLLQTIATNIMRFFKEATPLYCALLIAVWTASVGVQLKRRKYIQTAEWVAFAFAWLILAAYLRTAGWYRYFFEAMLLALIFLPHSLRTIATYMGECWSRYSRFFKYAPLVFILLLGAIQLYQLQFSSWVAEHYSASQTAILQKYFAAFPKDKTIFVYNIPHIVPLLPTTKYYQYFDIDPTGALGYGKEELLLLASTVPDAVVTRYDLWSTQPKLFAKYTEEAELGSYVVLFRTVTKTAVDGL